MRVLSFLLVAAIFTLTSAVSSVCDGMRPSIVNFRSPVAQSPSHKLKLVMEPLAVTALSLKGGAASDPQFEGKVALKATAIVFGLFGLLITPENPLPKVGVRMTESVIELICAPCAADRLHGQEAQQPNVNVPQPWTRYRWNRQSASLGCVGLSRSFGSDVADLGEQRQGPDPKNQRVLGCRRGGCFCPAHHPEPASGYGRACSHPGPRYHEFPGSVGHVDQHTDGM
eukprot:3934100-Rhodomonas_salina.2